ncbi:F-box protein [Salix suchowensis]|nr:F-box protein [Salix suchowensis]
MKKLKKAASMGSKRRRTTKQPGSSSSSSSTEQSECLVAQLPQALIIDILSRLPIRSSTELLLVEIVEEDFSNLEIIRLFPNINFPDTDFRILNSCNGLLCLYEDSYGKSEITVHVCNPVIGEYIDIPVVNTDKKFEQHFAFGFSSGSNEYKVLQTFFPDKDITAAPCLAEIYTVGTGEWRSIGNAPFRLENLDANAFLHDSIHWIEYSSCDGFVSAFDFVLEQLPIHDYGVCMEDEKFEIWFDSDNDIMCLLWQELDILSS